MQGCTEDTRSSEKADRYTCDYLYTTFQMTLCGKVNEDKRADYMGKELYFPLVESGCGENLCLCHAHSDAFLDYHFEHLCRKGQEHSFAGQWGQDKFLLQNVFREDLRLGEGIYVDVGASHPFHLSNTAYFDHCLGWRGICLDPNPGGAPALRGLRTCEVVTGCAWSTEESFRFSNSGELAAPVSDASESDLDFFEAKCSTLHDILVDNLGAALKGLPASTRIAIDLISVDAEGAEIEIFRWFPFEVWDIRAIVVETSRQTAMAIDGLILPHGFLKVAVLGKDAVYVHRRYASGLPPNGPLLPRRIAWNEPGSDSDTIEYMRFQRMFGVDSNLDEEVGDQRLSNETELERQRERMHAKHAESLQEVMKNAETAVVGGLWDEATRKAMESEEVQAALRDTSVRTALELLPSDFATFKQMLLDDGRLRAKVAGLIEKGVIRHDGAAKLLHVAPA